MVPTQVASAGLCTQPSNNEKRKIMKIKPVFTTENAGYDRIVITPTHFKRKPFKGYVTEKEAQTISKAIGLK